MLYPLSIHNNEGRTVLYLSNTQKFENSFKTQGENKKTSPQQAPTPYKQALKNIRLVIKDKIKSGAGRTITLDVNNPYKEKMYIKALEKVNKERGGDTFYFISSKQTKTQDQKAQQVEPDKKISNVKEVFKQWSESIQPKTISPQQALQNATLVIKDKLKSKTDRTITLDVTNRYKSTMYFLALKKLSAETEGNKFHLKSSKHITMNDQRAAKDWNEAMLPKTKNTSLLQKLFSKIEDKLHIAFEGASQKMQTEEKNIPVLTQMIRGPKALEI